MDCILVILLVLHVSTARKKNLLSDSNESIERFLYYKDCKHGNTEMSTIATTSTLAPQKQSLRENDQCPCPRMCFSMCCDCGNQFMGRQMEPLRDFQQSPMQSMVNQPKSTFPVISPPRQPPLPKIPPKQVKKNGGFKPKGGKFQLPIQSRRNLGLTKEHIRSLLSQDEDVKKILKDLVTVTMQKVDLVDKMNGKENSNVKVETSRNSEEYEYDD